MQKDSILAKFMQVGENYNKPRVIPQVGREKGRMSANFTYLEKVESLQTLLLP